MAIFQIVETNDLERKMTTIDTTDANPFEALKPNDVLTVFDIEWEDNGSLPTTCSVTLPDDFDLSDYDPDFAHEISIMLSDEYGYCVADHGRIEHSDVVIYP
jgi:hypothetical protein